MSQKPASSGGLVQASHSHCLWVRGGRGPWSLGGAASTQLPSWEGGCRSSSGPRLPRPGPASCSAPRPPEVPRPLLLPPARGCGCPPSPFLGRGSAFAVVLLPDPVSPPSGLVFSLPTSEHVLCHAGAFRAVPRGAGARSVPLIPCVGHGPWGYFHPLAWLPGAPLRVPRRTRANVSAGPSAPRLSLWDRRLPGLEAPWRPRSTAAGSGQGAVAFWRVAVWRVRASACVSGQGNEAGRPRQ